MDKNREKNDIYLLTGVMASGKSTAAEILAKRMERGVHLRGDVFRKMIVSGREEMSHSHSEEAIKQLEMRYVLTAEAAKIYCDNGFTVVVQDNYYGEMLPRMISMFDGYRVNVTVLCPSVGTVKKREKQRDKTGYVGFEVEQLYEDFMRSTPRIGFWLDTTELTAEQTVDAIIDHYK